MPEQEGGFQGCILVEGSPRLSSTPYPGFLPCIVKDSQSHRIHAGNMIKWEKEMMNGTGVGYEDCSDRRHPWQQIRIEESIGRTGPGRACQSDLLSG